MRQENNDRDTRVLRMLFLEMVATRQTERDYPDDSRLFLDATLRNLLYTQDTIPSTKQTETDGIVFCRDAP